MKTLMFVYIVVTWGKAKLSKTCIFLQLSICVWFYVWRFYYNRKRPVSSHLGLLVKRLQSGHIVLVLLVGVRFIAGPVKWLTNCRHVRTGVYEFSHTACNESGKGKTKRLMSLVTYSAHRQILVHLICVANERWFVKNILLEEPNLKRKTHSDCLAVLIAKLKCLFLQSIRLLYCIVHFLGT